MFRIVALFAIALFAPLSHAQSLQTVAEKSEYKSTSKYADVVAFCEAIAKRGPTARLEYFGISHEGRKLPLLIISDPPVASAEEAKTAGKLVVMAFANIHAGEVDGKEALLALARDLTDKPNQPLLKDLVILLVPILNADGNDKIDPKNRHDNGPVEGAGTRENARGLDLNRDFVKLETPEVRALVKLFNTWDPLVVIDCHTTNGSKHRYTLTYDGPRYPLVRPELCSYESADINQMFAAVTKKVKLATGFDIAPYGNFSDDHTRWETYPALPRFGVQYIAARGRIGILSESYTHAPFKDRIQVTRAFVTACFEFATRWKKWSLSDYHIGEIPLRTKTDALSKKLTILGFAEEMRGGKRVATDTPKDYELDFIARVKPTLTVERSHGYLIPARFTEAIQTLQRHGADIHELREDIELDIESYQIAAVDVAARPFQNHQLVSVEATPKPGRRMIPAGTAFVRTSGAHPLVNLVPYLLEPQSEDGLTTWGFFNDGLRPGGEFPVLRLLVPPPLTLGALAPLPENRVVNQPVTEALLIGHGGGFSFGLQGSPVSVGEWLDAEHFLQTKEGKLWKVEARTGKAEPFADPELIAKSLKALKELDASEAESMAKGRSFRFNPNRTAFWFTLGPDLALGYFDGRPAVRLTKSDGTKDSVTFAPDGKRLAFVRGGNLFAVDVEKAEEKQLTHDGGGDILNGVADWVYEEEIFNRDGKAFWWSLDGKQLAFMRFDDSPVKKFNILNLNPVRGHLEAYPYPKVGDPNPIVKIGVVSAGGGKPAFLDFGEHKPEDIVIARVGWLPDSKTVFAYVQNRTQTWLDFTTWSAPDAKPKVLFRDTTKAWVDDTGPPHWLPDGSFLYASDRSGWRHLYHYAADGKLLGPVTSGEWEVKDVLRVDGPEKTVYFTATFTSHTGTDLCRVKLGGETKLLTEKGKSHRVALAPSGPLFIDRYTDPMTPTKARVVEVAKGDVRKLDTNPVREKDGFKFGKFERVKIPMKDGFELEGAITYPPNFDPMKKYPVWMFTYAGPHMPTLRDEWGGGRIMDNSLGTSGVIVFRVDPRSASGKGAQSAWTCYKQLGVQELKDLEEAVAWLAEKPGVDATHVGISGHSYGGFMAAYALTHSKTFSAGIASGPVTDWKLYDSIYTERYMLTPKENEAGYAKSSCVAAAKTLHGKLLIVHGMMDDNVHMQNSVQLADSLQRSGKEFEMMFYPQARHGIGGAHYMKLQLDFIRRTMGVAK